MLLDQLLSAPDLPPLDSAAEKGFLCGRYCCPICGEGLGTRDAGRVHVDQSMAVDGLRPVVVHVGLTTFRCAYCRHECVEPRDAMVNDLMRASARAYQSAQIAPGRSWTRL